MTTPEDDLPPKPVRWGLLGLGVVYAATSIAYLPLLVIGGVGAGLYMGIDHLVKRNKK